MKYLTKAFIIFLVISSLTLKIHPIKPEGQVGISTPLLTKVTSVDIGSKVKGTGYVQFAIMYEAEIWNKFDIPIEISHSDTCKFHLDIEPPKIEDGTRIYNSIGCGEAITPVSYSPGLTVDSGTTWILVEDVSYESLPNGIYKITLGEPDSWSYQDNVTFVASYMEITNGEIVEFMIDPTPPLWDYIDTPTETESKSESINIYFPNLFVSVFSFIFFIFVMKQK